MKHHTLLAVLFLSFGLAFAQEEIDTSKCENCDVFPLKFLEVADHELLKFTDVPVAEQLHFLEGEWQLYFPADQSVGFEIFTWFKKDKMLEGVQDWALHPDHLDRIPFRAKTMVSYLEKQQRWELVWIVPGSPVVIYSGSLVDGTRFEFYENAFEGTPFKLKVSHPYKYTFHSITADSFVADFFESGDEGKTYKQLLWRLYYKRRS